jgi:hypothetical protein
MFSVGSAPRLHNEDPRPAERIIQRELRVDSRELSSAKQAEDRWRYSRFQELIVGSWQLRELTRFMHGWL